MTSSQLTKKAE